eukprot:SAG25_NODE_3564_length_1039_cov_1.234043_1_plen_85_part_01
MCVLLLLLLLLLLLPCMVACIFQLEQARRAEERAAHFGATAAVLGEQDEPFLLRAEPWVEGLQQGAVWRSELGGGGGGGVGGGSG